MLPVEENVVPSDSHFLSNGAGLPSREPVIEANLWQPRTIDFGLARDLIKLGLCVELSGKPQLMLPEEDFLRLFWEPVHSGAIIRIVDDTPVTPSGMEGLFSESIITLQQQFAGLFVQHQYKLGQALTPHGNQILNQPQEIRPYATPAVKNLLVHVDVERHGESPELTPAEVTILAWGQHKNVPPTALNFLDTNSLSQPNISQMMGRPSSGDLPFIRRLYDRAIDHLLQVSKPLQVDIPPHTLTIFTNQGLAHGALADEWRNGIALNAEIISQRRALSGAVREEDRVVRALQAVLL